MRLHPIFNEDAARQPNRLDRIVWHLCCLVRDRKYSWHIAGVWREVTLH
jgi:hypothetical protein